MSDYQYTQARGIPAGRADMAVDAGLRAFMLGVYNKMAVGLLLSGCGATSAVSGWLRGDGQSGSGDAVIIGAPGSDGHTGRTKCSSTWHATAVPPSGWRSATQSSSSMMRGHPSSRS